MVIVDTPWLAAESSRVLLILCVSLAAYAIAAEYAHVIKCMPNMRMRPAAWTVHLRLG